MSVEPHEDCLIDVINQPSPEGGWQRHRRSIIIEALLIAVPAVIIAAVSDMFDIFEIAVVWVRQYENWEVDEIFIVACYLSVALSIFSLRRWRDVIVMARDQRKAIAELTAAHREVAAGRFNLEHAARTDRLTGLPNRALLLERIEHGLRLSRANDGSHFAVLFLDFDHFKFVNDSLGHQAGDELLQEISARLRRQLRCGDSLIHEISENTVGRLGGDEFVVVVRDVKESEDAAQVAQRLLATLHRPFQLQHYHIHTNASIGIVVSSPAYERAEDMLRDADTAMYEAKRQGRGRYVFFDDSLRKRSLRRVELEHDLRDAVGTDQLWLAYQPIVKLATGEIVGVEGLLRWRHPEEGMIPPSEFVPIAEETELILELGEWVLWEGVWQLARWIEELGDRAPKFVSLNVSRKQFNQPGLDDQLAELIHKTAIDPGRIQIEITEDTCATDLDAAIEIMNRIKAIGVKLAIDDFGVGTSSLSALQRFPVDVLKVDRSLLVGIDTCPDTTALLHSLAILVRNLGIQMVAEGVEMESQVTSLCQLGCHHAQGFFYSKPMSAADLEQHLVIRRDSDRSAAAVPPENSPDMAGVTMLAGDDLETSLP